MPEEAQLGADCYLCVPKTLSGDDFGFGRLNFLMDGTAFGSVTRFGAVSGDGGPAIRKALEKDGENRPVKIFAGFDRVLPRCRARLSEPP